MTERDTLTLKFQHSSLQFSDTPAQQDQDIQDLFTKGGAFPIKTGTEAGPDAHGHNMNRAHLQAQAKAHKHALGFFRDNWIAVDRSIIQRGTLEFGSVFVADNDETVGHGHDSGFCTARFTHADPRIGEVAVAACHYPTKGRTPQDPNYDVNERYANLLGQWAKREGRGPALVFVAGDFNMPWGKPQDVFFDNPLTSAPDELRKIENTGHGPIDGVASYDRDGRVSAKWVNVLTDREFFQHSDHFVVRTAFSVRALKVA